QTPAHRAHERALSSQRVVEPVSPRTGGGHRTDERAPVQRPGAQPLPKEGVMREPRAAEAGYGRPSSATPGRSDAEFRSNAADILHEQPSPRSGWDRLFGRGR